MPDVLSGADRLRPAPRRRGVRSQISQRWSAAGRPRRVPPSRPKGSRPPGLVSDPRPTGRRPRRGHDRQVVPRTGRSHRPGARLGRARLHVAWGGRVRGRLLPRRLAGRSRGGHRSPHPVRTAPRRVDRRVRHRRFAGDLRGRPGQAGPRGGLAGRSRRLRRVGRAAPPAARARPGHRTGPRSELSPVVRPVGQAAPADPGLEVRRPARPPVAPRHARHRRHGRSRVRRPGHRRRPRPRRAVAAAERRPPDPPRSTGGRHPPRLARPPTSRGGGIDRRPRSTVEPEPAPLSISVDRRADRPTAEGPRDGRSASATGGTCLPACDRRERVSPACPCPPPFWPS